LVYRTTQLPDPADATTNEGIDILRIEYHIGELLVLMKQVCERGEVQRSVGTVALEKLQTAAMWCMLAVRTKGHTQ
jgi:hypothetical protein